LIQRLGLCSHFEKKGLSITHGLHIKMMHIAAKSDSVEELKKTKGVFPKVVP
jgi:hypothetical protein